MILEENENLTSVVEDNTGLKELIVNYIGKTLSPETGDVTVEMAVEVFASEFPEFLMAIAEENFIRGYQQAFLDLAASGRFRE
jgi:hypothetical protein